MFVAPSNRPRQKNATSGLSVGGVMVVPNAHHPRLIISSLNLPCAEWVSFFNYFFVLKSPPSLLASLCVHQSGAVSARHQDCPARACRIRCCFLAFSAMFGLNRRNPRSLSACSRGPWAQASYYRSMRRCAISLHRHSIGGNIFRYYTPRVFPVQHTHTRVCHHRTKAGSFRYYSHGSPPCSCFFSFAIASPGFRPFGQVLLQFCWGRVDRTSVSSHAREHLPHGGGGGVVVVVCARACVCQIAPAGRERWRA